MKKHGLELGPMKSEYIVLAGRRRAGPIALRVGEHHFLLKRTVKYLGITIDRACKFSEHIVEVCGRTERTLTALKCLTSSQVAPRASKRWVIMSAVTSIVLYAAPVWRPTLAIRRNLSRLKILHR